MIRRTILTGVLIAFGATGCVSTTSGPPPVETNEDTAAESNYNLGREYFLRNNYDRARAALERAIEFDPRMGKAHMMLGLTYERLEVPRLARQHYERAVRFEPGSFDIRNAYAVFLCGQRDFDEARKQFDRVVRAEENDNPAPMMTNAGVCMAQKPDAELAEEYFRAALEARRDYPEALLQLALLKRRGGDDLSARAFLQRYLSVQPASPSILFLAMQIERDMGDSRAERDYRRQLLAEFPESAEARRVLETG